MFECEDGFRFTARKSGNAVWLFLPEHTLQLPRVRAESGNRYASAELNFWNQGDVALLETEPGSRRQCVNNRAQAVWEHAKLGGVDFRATGNEPAWHMEITLDGEIRLVTDYGQSTNRFKTPRPDIDQNARETAYAVEDCQHRLVVELQGKQSRNSMSNQLFEVTVAVTLDEQQLHGCGRALH